MNQKSAMGTLTGVLFILLVAATASARDKVIVSKPVSASAARERGSLDQALSQSTHERAERESYFQAAGDTARNELRDPSIRALRVDIGDELGGAAGPGYENPSVEHELHVKAAAKELDGEWKEVNKHFKPVPRDRKAIRVSERSRGSAGGSSASSLPASRTHKSARAESDDGLQD